jgi:branched-chain amino acid aminotransferase
MAPNTLPAMAKVAGNYLNSMLIRTEAIRNGYAEGIALNVDGTVSEGSGETVFVVMKGKLYTPPLASSILRGITRDSVMMLAADLGIAVIEEAIPRELLYCADEIFLCGSAAEISPVRSVDRKNLRAGAPGPVTRALQSEFSDIAYGRREDRHGWLTVVDSANQKEKVTS